MQFNALTSSKVAMSQRGHKSDTAYQSVPDDEPLSLEEFRDDVHQLERYHQSLQRLRLLLSLCACLLGIAAVVIIMLLFSSELLAQRTKLPLLRSPVPDSQ